MELGIKGNLFPGTHTLSLREWGEYGYSKLLAGVFRIDWSTLGSTMTSQRNQIRTQTNNQNVEISAVAVP
jgi:hypothetical protein